MARTDRKPRRRLDPSSRRTAILEMAAKTFAAQPYNEVTISSIADSVEASSALVYRYFDGKESLYAEVVRLAITNLMTKQADALAELPAGTPVRDQVQVASIVYLDHIASHPEAWALPLRQPDGEPQAAATLRSQARRKYIKYLEDLLPPSRQPRHTYALWGYLGFIDAACLRWVERGCPKDERWPLIESALGALEGALGDWAA